MILLAAGILSLAVITGLVIDAGRGYSARRSMEAAAEAAAHAGAFKLQTSWNGSGFGTLTDAQVQQYAKTYASYNGWGDTSNFNGNFNGNQAGGQWYLTYVNADGATTNDTMTTNARGVEVQLSIPQSATFLRLAGIDKYDIFARATAMFGSALSVPALPLGINDDAFTPGTNCVPPGSCTPAGFQPANGSGNYGNYNFASIVPPGCVAGNLACYTNAMQNGTSPPIGIGTSYPTNSFDQAAVSASNANALRTRINARPAETCTNFTMPSPRVVFLPVINGNVGGASVTFIRFRAIFITTIAAPNGFSGCFVYASASSGTFDPNAVGTGFGGVTIMKLVRSPGTVSPMTITVSSITAPAHPNLPATLTIMTTPNAYCTVLVQDPNPSAAAGLGATYADNTGKVTWNWTVEPAAQPGSWPVTITCTYHALVGRNSTTLVVT